MKTHRLLLLAALALPTVAWAATVAGKIVWNGKPAPGKALVIGGVPYIRAADAAKLAGVSFGFDSRTNTLRFGSKAGKSALDPPQGNGGAMQRGGNEGPMAKWLITPSVGIRVDSITVEDDFGTPQTVVRGKLRNTSPIKRLYEVADAVLVTQAGETVKYRLTAQEISNTSLLELQKAEEVKFQIVFPAANDGAKRAVLTFRDWDPRQYNVRKETVFRVQF